MDQEIIIVLGFGALQMIIGWTISRLYKRIDKMEEDMMSMKMNYLTRFDDAKDHRYEIEKKILEAINDITNKLDIHIVKTTGEIDARKSNV